MVHHNELLGTFRHVHLLCIQGNEVRLFANFCLLYNLIKKMTLFDIFLVYCDITAMFDDEFGIPLKK